MKHHKILLGLVSMAALTLAACQTDGGSRLQVEPHNSTDNMSEKTEPSPKQTRRYVKGHILVGFKPQENYHQAISQLEKQHDGAKLKRMLMENDSAVIALFTVPKGQEKSLIALFQQHQAVEYAEVDGIMTTQ